MNVPTWPLVPGDRPGRRPAGGGQVRGWVNALGTEWSEGDVAAVRGLPGLRGTVARKSKSGAGPQHFGTGT